MSTRWAAVEQRSPVPRCIPGGVNSSIRAFKCGRRHAVRRGSGRGPVRRGTSRAHRYIDLVQSYGAVILGHAHPAITAAHRRLPPPTARRTARRRPARCSSPRRSVERVPSCERVRLMNSGTEATSTAVRLARGVHRPRPIVIFHGNFHGATDALLAAGGSGVATLGPARHGRRASRCGGQHARRAVQRRARRSTSRSPRCSSSPSPPTWASSRRRPGFLEGLRAECDRVGALLVFDEVITGFRLGTGGAQAKYDVHARPHDASAR